MVHCLAQCINLCLQSLNTKVIYGREALDVVKGISDLIRHSPKRSALFDSLKAQVIASTPSLKPLCPTRRTVHTSAFNAVLANYSILLEALENIQQGSDEYATKATGLSIQWTYFGIKVSYLVILAIEQLSITLQGKDTTV